MKTDGTILTELKNSQIELEKGQGLFGELPWFLLNDIFDAANDLTNDASNLDQIPVPTNFLREYDQGTLWLYDTTQTNPWVRLEKAPDLESLLDSRTRYSVVSGTPLNYQIHNATIIIGPQYPDVQKTFRWAYYKKDTVLSSGADIENLWLEKAPEVLVNHAGMTLAAFYLQNPNLAQVFDAKFKAAVDALSQENVQRLHANSESKMQYVHRI